MKKFLTVVATLCVFAMLAGLVSTVRAADEGEKKAEAKKVEKAKQPSETPFIGNVTAIDAKAMTLEVTTGPKLKQTFVVGADAKITKDGKEFKFADIVTGNVVEGFYVKKGGKKVAKEINVAKEPPKAEQKAPEGEKKAEAKKVEKAAAPHPFPYRGHVTALDAKAMTLEVTVKEAKQAFVINADTKVWKDGKEFKFADVAKGNYVVVHCIKDGEKMVAKKVVVFDKEPEQKPKEAPKAPKPVEKAPEGK